MSSIDSLSVMLARLQFAWTIGVHILFPSFTIGLASYLAVLEALWLKTGKQVYIRLFKYWMKVFAMVFGMGVVSGIVMSYEFGTNWSVFADKTGPVLGPLLAYEVLSAFFLEAGFLGIMLFGLEKVGRKLHFTATVLVAVGTFFSAFWILSANSWMQTPAGYGINEVGQFVPKDWLKIIFNPSFPYRLAHMVTAAYLTTAFVVGAVGAWHLLRDKDCEGAKVMFSMAMWMATFVAPAQIIIGDMHGLNTLEHQPAKIAAVEGHFETQKGAPLILFGMPDMEAEKTKYKVGIPKLGSLILTHHIDGEIKGLKDFPKADRPYSPVVFWAFRLMVGLGFLMALTGLVSLWLRWRGRLFEHSLFHKFAVLMGPAGFVAVLSGWTVTEVGRQPYTVYGLLRTVHSVGPVETPAIATSLLIFVVAYFLIFGIGVYYIFKMLAAAPTPGQSAVASDHPLVIENVVSSLEREQEND